MVHEAVARSLALLIRVWNTLPTFHSIGQLPGRRRARAVLMIQRRCRVLLVEDDSEEALLFFEAVERAGVPWSLRAAATRQQAIEAMCQPSLGTDDQVWGEPDFVVLDVRLGEGSGFHVLRWIRTHLRERMIPVIVFSGSTEPGIAEQAKEYGSTNFVAKPGSLDGAIQVVKRLHAEWCVAKLSPCSGESAAAS